MNTYFKNNSSKIFSCICASANTGPTCILAKLIPQDVFPACIGFVPGGNVNVILFEFIQNNWLEYNCNSSNSLPDKELTRSFS